MAKKKQRPQSDEHHMEPQDLANMDPHPKDVAGEDVDVIQYNDTIRNEINAKRREMLEKEAEQSLDEKPAEAVADTEGFSPADSPEVVAPSLGENSEPAAGPIPIPRKYNLNIRGQNIECTEDEMLAMAQKNMAAEQTFREAAEMRRQAEALMFSQQQPQQQAAQPNTQRPFSDGPISNDALKDIARRMNYGTEEDQVNALREAMELGARANQGRATGPTPEQLVHIATQNALAVIDTRTEQEILSREFPDILQDIPLAHATDLIANQLAQKYQYLGVSKGRVELLREAGTLTRQKYLGHQLAAPQPMNVPSATMAISNDRIERKRTSPQPPSAANKIASDPNAINGVSSAQALDHLRRQGFNQIAKSRGQQA